MNNNIYRINGYITKSEIFKPYQPWDSDKYIHRVFLEPTDIHMFEELEHQAHINEVRSEKSTDNPDLDNPFRSETDLITGCAIKFQTLNRPKLTGKFKNAEHDDDLYHQYVTVVSSMITLDDGNSLMNIIAIDEAVEPDFDLEVDASECVSEPLVD